MADMQLITDYDPTISFKPPKRISNYNSGNY